MDKKDELIEVLEEYIQLLSNEIDDLVGIASIHGWGSARVKQGEALREKIENLKL